MNPLQEKPHYAKKLRLYFPNLFIDHCKRFGALAEIYSRLFLPTS